MEDIRMTVVAWLILTMVGGGSVLLHTDYGVLCVRVKMYRKK